jgi:uncharacterized protein YcsI (UPF0317 family)
MTTHEEFRALDAAELRQAIRLGHYRGHTAGLAQGRLQAGVVILPHRLTDAFLKYCARNPKALPLVGLNRTGDPSLPTLGDIDLRTDLPQYDVFRAGRPVLRRIDIADLWRDDFAAFALASTLSIAHALLEAGIPLRHLASGRNLPFYRSSIGTRGAGPLSGPTVVSMRPIGRELVDKVRALTARYPHAHGAPVHVGDPAAIGIADLDRPDWGDATALRPGEVPVFWASALTAQDALKGAGTEIFIMNPPGHMLVTDVDADADVGQFRLV